MKHFLKYLSLAMLFATTAALADNCNNYYEECQDCGTTTFIPRPQGLYSFITQASLFNPWYYKCNDGTIDSCATYNLGFRYDQTWKGERLAQCLFGTDADGVLNFHGLSAETATDPAKKYVVANDYGLASTMDGAVSFKPKVQNYNIDFAARWELGHCNDCLEGLYFGLAATLTHSAWDLNYCNVSSTDNGFSNWLYNCEDSINGQAAYTDIKTALEMNSGFGDVKTPAKYGRFVLDGSQNKTALANIDMLLGYDFLRCDGYHLGLFFKAVAPTGNRPAPETVFSPIVGNAHHWEVGGGLDAHWDMWSCDDQCFSLFMNGSVTHLFNDKQWRTFDLTNGCMSRNALLKVFQKFTSDTDVTTFEYDQLIRASDWSTRYVESKFDVMGDASLKFMYRTCGWAFGLGYNIYGRSAEKIDQIADECNLPTQLVAVKGTSSAGKTEVDGEFVFCEGVSDVQPNYNPSSPTPNTDSTAMTALTAATINYAGAPRQIQHTVFGNLDYQWQDCENQPFAGIGGMCSFAQNSKCDVCTASQWGLWIHGGLTF